MTYIPKPGDFAVVTVKGTVGKLIRFGQWLIGGDFANYEHAFVFIGDTYKSFPSSIIEAQPNGARLAYLVKYKPSEIAWYSCPEDKGATICVKAMCLLGTPYSFMDYFAIAMQHGPWFIRKTLGKALSKYVSDSGHMICSQLVDEIYRRAGIQLFSDGRLPGNVTPDDLWELIEKQEDEKIYES